jgi:hypothetical protein
MLMILLQVLWLIYVANRNEPIVNRVVTIKPMDNQHDVVILTNNKNNTIYGNFNGYNVAY